MNLPALLFATLGISLVGCGGGTLGSGGGAGQGGTFRTSVSGALLLDSLSSGQATQLCNDVNSANTATLGPTYCASLNHSSALLDTDAYLREDPTTTNADLQTDCSQALTANEASGCPSAASCDATTITPNSPSCVATVADVVNCINENDALTRKFMADTPTCDVVTASSVTAYVAPGGPLDTDTGVSMSASCEALAGCNGIWTLSNVVPPGS